MKGILKCPSKTIYLIKEIKKSLNTAIRAKGSDIADATRFDQYPDKINGIETGRKELARYTVDEDGTAYPTSTLSKNAFDAIKKIHDKALYNDFFNAFDTVTIVEGIFFNNLVEIGAEGLAYAFRYPRDLKKVSFPKLQKIGARGLAQTFDIMQER